MEIYTKCLHKTFSMNFLKSLMFLCCNTRGPCVPHSPHWEAPKTHMPLGSNVNFYDLIDIFVPLLHCTLSHFSFFTFRYLETLPCVEFAPLDSAAIDNYHPDWFFISQSRVCVFTLQCTQLTHHHQSRWESPKPQLSPAFFTHWWRLRRKGNVKTRGRWKAPTHHFPILVSLKMLQFYPLESLSKTATPSSTPLIPYQTYSTMITCSLWSVAFPHPPHVCFELLVE